MLKKYIVALFASAFLFSCSGSDEFTEQKSSDSYQSEVVATAQFTNGTSMSLFSKSPKKAYIRAAGATETIERKAYFFIREDGNTLNSSVSGSQESYWPQGTDYLGNPNGTTKEGTMKENEGRFFFNENSYDAYDSSKYGTVYSLKDGVDIRKFLVGDFETISDGTAIKGTGIPKIENIISQKGCPLTYNSETDTVIWYAIKNREVATGHFHIDGVIRKKTDIKENLPERSVKIDINTELERSAFIEADDFAIRVDGEYIDNIVQNKNIVKTQRYGTIVEKTLEVSVNNIEELEVGKEYTYETWLWVKNNTDENTGFSAFSEEEKEKWLNGEHIGNKCKVTVSDGFEVVKYDVYKGVSGHQDTPYIKVSIHIKKK